VASLADGLGRALAVGRYGVPPLLTAVSTIGAAAQIALPVGSDARPLPPADRANDRSTLPGAPGSVDAPLPPTG
jgi:hypothetical protein